MRIVLFSSFKCSVEMTGDGENVHFEVRSWDGEGERRPITLPVVGRFRTPAAELIHQINLVTEPTDDKEMNDGRG